MTKKGYLFVAIVTLITVIAWVAFDIAHKRSEVQIPSDLDKLVEPIDPSFDLGALK